MLGGRKAIDLIPRSMIANMYDHQTYFYVHQMLSKNELVLNIEISKAFAEKIQIFGFSLKIRKSGNSRLTFHMETIGHS